MALVCGCTPKEQRSAPREDLHHWRNLGVLYFRAQSERLDSATGDPSGFQQAAEWLGRVAAASPDDVQDQLNHARALLFAGEDHWPRASAPLERARAAFAGKPEPAEVSYLFGIYFNRRGDHAAALVEFRRTIDRLRQAPTQWFPQVWYQCVLAEEKVRDYAAAERTCRELIDFCAASDPPPIDPRFRRPALYRLSQILVALGRGAEAGPIIEQLQRLEMDKTLAHEECELTEVSLRRGSLDVDPPEIAWSWQDITQEYLRDWSDVPLDRGVALDLEGDGGVELLVLGPGQIGVLKRTGASPHTLPHAFAADLVNSSKDAIAGDLDNDGDPDIVLLGAAPRVLQCATPGDDPRFRLVPISLPSAIHGAQLIDTDHEGHLDIAGLDAQGTFVILRNRGDEQLDFEPITPLGPVPGHSAGARIGAHDLDQANDLDIVLPGGPGTPAVAYLNLRDGTYAPVPLEGFGAHPIMFVEDFDGDGAPDVFATGGAGGWSYAPNADRDGLPYRLRMRATVTGEAATTGAVHDAKLADLDNDGDLDVALATETGLRILRNHRLGEFELENGPPLARGTARTLEIADLDGDRRLDWIVGTDDRRLHVFSNRSAAYLGILLLPKGKSDNLAGIGAVVETFSGQRYRSSRIRTSWGHAIGTGEHDLERFDGVRVRWPGGLKQAIPRQELAMDDTRCAVFDQVDGPFVSCPFLYTFGEDGWRFATDVIGIAPLGEWTPPGVEPHLDPEEYVRIPGRGLAITEGRVRIAITEELRETAYVDRVELLWIDHADDLEVYLDESTRQEGPADPLYVYAIPVDSMRPFTRVWANRVDDSPNAGALDGTAATRTLDGEYFHGYRVARPQWTGWVPPFAVDFASDRTTRAVLLTGRIYWYDSAGAYSRWLRGHTWAPPRLERASADGSRRVLLDDLGLPAGMDRTLVCTFPEVAAGSTLRIRAEHQLFWDRMLSVEHYARVEIAGAAGTTVLPSGETLVYHTARVKRATLSNRGISSVVGNRRLHEETYDYGRTGPCATFDRAVGLATRYGDVTGLLDRPDDRVAVLTTGDGMEIEFEVSTPTESRTYFLKVTGWAKENGYHVKHGQTIEPLPFRDMSEYPPPAGEAPTTAEYTEYLKEHQTRAVRR